MNFWFAQHISGQGSLWTKKYRPIRIIEVVYDPVESENDKTLEVMGIGGSWCKLELSEKTKEAIVPRVVSVTLFV